MEGFRHDRLCPSCHVRLIGFSFLKMALLLAACCRLFCLYYLLCVPCIRRIWYIGDDKHYIFGFVAVYPILRIVYHIEMIAIVSVVFFLGFFWLALMCVLQRFALRMLVVVCRPHPPPLYIHFLIFQQLF